MRGRSLTTAAALLVVLVVVLALLYSQAGLQRPPGFEVVVSNAMNMRIDGLSMSAGGLTKELAPIDPGGRALILMYRGDPSMLTMKDREGRRYIVGQRYDGARPDRMTIRLTSSGAGGLGGVVSVQNGPNSWPLPSPE